ncbi:hypothetical protein LshimejAT787_1005500 [Lyophyllum shimeji]|uniref:Uncharacterized protein n=1 Tax=Lyophyllum shimeji TaxID=47721 RepID=A0A9P3US19_LYOSH|nr:hypothetical protein LshimejAT787_1005500 [Lyophyllum shimeji]
MLLFWCLPQVRRSEAGVEVVKLESVAADHQDVGSSINSVADAPTIPAYSLTAILPVTQETVARLEEQLAPLLEPSQLREIILLCPQTTISHARSVIRKVISSSALDCPDILLQTSGGGLDYRANLIQAASQVATEWVLLMDHEGLARETNHSRNVLLHPPAVSIPFGPRGTCLSAHHLTSSIRFSESEPQPASYLRPPFVMPGSLAAMYYRLSGKQDVWVHFGEQIAKSRADGIGGIISGTNADAYGPLPELGQSMIDENENISDIFENKQWDRNASSPKVYSYDRSALDTSRNSGFFVVLLPELDDLRHLSALLCMLRGRGHLVKVGVYQEPMNDGVDREDRRLTSEHCDLPYESLISQASGPRQVSRWAQDVGSGADVLITLLGENGLGILLDKGPVHVQLSREDLVHSSWMGSLALREWQNWNTPRVDISIITKDRPQSLARLLTSLSRALFFGDSVNLRLNLEQSSDPETMRIAENISWRHGSVFIHHRIIQGGLLPAVVESWYPSSNDTYGLLLEDDVELSPLFYAWAKMSLLRYRYGDPQNRSSRMFGFSLYQQKNVELPPEGRRPFNARNLFKNSGFADITTPYLSPIPCSWGAIYFPEHWREFHAYLSFRFSEFPFKIDQIIVPNVRSNKWTKSWKKYFIELVYLRGYVMLYPNYPDFISLSTNHLEVGSHVKVRTKEKQELFLVPLMQLPPASSPPTHGLLDLPGNTLPDWNALPVLNLTGSLATLAALAEMGHARRTELTGCTSAAAPFDTQDLVCIKHMQERHP